MQIKNGKDFWAGLMFLAFGLGFMIVAWNNYAMGTAVRMGPAYFPVMLGGLCAVLGVLIFFRSFISRLSFPLRVFDFRWLPFVVGLGLGLVAYWVKGPTGGGFWYQVLLAACLIAITGAFGPRHLYIILSSVVIFAFLLKPLGLFITTIILIILSRAGDAESFEAATIPKSILFAFAVLLVFWLLFKLFGLFMGAGLAMTFATVLGVVVGTLVPRRLKGVELGALGGVLGVFTIGAFVFGLGLPFNVCPIALDDACRAIGLGK